MRILVEHDHFLRILAVILDPEAPEEHRRAVADFQAHDIPDFVERCDQLQREIAGLYPAEVRFAQDQAALMAQLPYADVVVLESLQLDESAVSKMKPSAIVQKFGALTSNIDVNACARRRIPLLNLTRKGNIAVAEHAFGLMLSLAKDIVRYNRVLTAEQWRERGSAIRPYDRRYIGGSNYARIQGLRMMADATLGLVGLGEVGREIAWRANAFGMSILYHQRTRLAATDELNLGARYVELIELMRASDYIIVQLPLNDSTRGIIGARELDVVKPGAMLINTARAALVDREALVASLQSDRLGGLAMDVGYEEPWQPDDPLLKLNHDNIILTPHTAVARREVGLSDLEDMCRKIWLVLDSRRTGRRN